MRHSKTFKILLVVILFLVVVECSYNFINDHFNTDVSSNVIETTKDITTCTESEKTVTITEKDNTLVIDTVQEVPKKETTQTTRTNIHETSIWYDPDGSQYAITEYDTKHRPIKEELHHIERSKSRTYVYEYDESGNKIDEKTFDADFKLLTHSAKTYYPTGEIKTDTLYGGDEKKLLSDTTEYYASGKEKKNSILSKNGSSIITDYDTGIITEYIVSDDGENYSISHYTLNYEKIIDYVVYNADGSVLGRVR